MGEQQRRNGRVGGKASAFARGEHVWTEDDDALLIELRIEEGLEWEQVAVAMGQGLSKLACSSRYDRISGKDRVRRPYNSVGFVAPNAVAIDRDRREAARSAMSITASVLGDPPPGYSALDRKRAQA